MIAELIAAAALAVAVVEGVLGFNLARQLERAHESAMQERSRLLDRIQAPQLAAAHASQAWDDPLAAEEPTFYRYDDTGLIVEPVFASDREPPADG